MQHLYISLVFCMVQQGVIDKTDTNLTYVLTASSKHYITIQLEDSLFGIGNSIRNKKWQQCLNLIIVFIC